MVVEGHGGTWGTTAKDAFKALCEGYANHNGVSKSSACSDFAQRMSITLERENARAILRRLTPVGSDDIGCNAAAWAVDMHDEFEEGSSPDVVMSAFQRSVVPSLQK